MSAVHLIYVWFTSGLRLVYILFTSGFGLFYSAAQKKVLGLFHVSA